MYGMFIISIGRFTICCSISCRVEKVDFHCYVSWLECIYYPLLLVSCEMLGVFNFLKKGSWDLLEVMTGWGKVLQAIIDCRSMFKSCGCFNLDSNISSNSPARIELSYLTLHLMFTMISLVQTGEVVVACPNSISPIERWATNFSMAHRTQATYYGMTAMTSDLPELKSFSGSQFPDDSPDTV